ncbi:MAG: hypothetical protein KJ574_03950 [Nanoarchaeota archaeon]|nr:hypothetical protein [Nanoarchaeota archaeon]
MTDEIEELEALLTNGNGGNGAQKQRRIVKSQVPLVIPITKGAREKARLLGPLVEQVGKEPFEWYGFTLGDTGDEKAMIRDVLLTDKQEVQNGFVSVKGEKVAKASIEVQKMNQERGTDYQIVGWTHNHADFGTTPSHTDEENHRTVLNSVSLNTERYQRIPLKLIETDLETKIEGDSVMMTGQNAEDATLQYTFPKEEAVQALLEKYGIRHPDAKQKAFALRLLQDLLEAAKLDILETKITGFCYSIVVNNKGDEPHGQIIAVEENAITGGKKYMVKKAPLKIIEVDDDIEVSEEQLVKEIKERIVFPARLPRLISKWLFGGWSSWGSGKSYGSDYFETGYSGKVFEIDSRPTILDSKPQGETLPLKIGGESSVAIAPSEEDFDEERYRKFAEQWKNASPAEREAMREQMRDRYFQKRRGLVKVPVVAPTIRDDTPRKGKKGKGKKGRQRTAVIQGGYKDLEAKLPEVEKQIETEFSDDDQQKIGFIKALFAYQEKSSSWLGSQQREDGITHENIYSYWTRDMLKNVEKTKDMRDAVYRTEKFSPNDKRGYATEPWRSDLEKIALILYQAEYDEPEQEFMRGFKAAKSGLERDRILEAYVTKVQETYQQEEEDEITLLVGSTADDITASAATSSVADLLEEDGGIPRKLL